MTPINHFRLTQALVLAALVAALTAPTVALGGSNPGKPAPDWFERYAASHTPSVALDGRSPDTLDASDAIQLRAVDGRAPDTLDAIANTRLQVADGRAPDTLDAIANTRPQVADGRAPDTLDASDAIQLQAVDGRAPDTLDAVGNTRVQIADGRSADTLNAASRYQPIETVSPGSFDWADAGIGAMFATMIIALIAGAMRLLARVHRRQRVQATS